MPVPIAESSPNRATFPTPDDPATVDMTKLQNQLNVYLAVEAGVRVRFSAFPYTMSINMFELVL